MPFAQILWILGLFALIPLLGAQFGSGNQVEQLSLIARLNDPNFALGDHYIDNSSDFSPRVYYTGAVALLTSFLPVPLVLAALGVLSNFGLALVSYLVAFRQFRLVQGAALLAALMVITNSSISLGLAGFLRFDSVQPANPAIPLALAGLALMAGARMYLAVLMLVASALAHPLIGVEIALLAFFGAGVTALGLYRGADVLRRLVHLALAGVLFAAAIAYLWALPLVKANAQPMSDAQFFDILVNFRAPHHYLGLEFYWRSWLEAGLFVIGTALAAAWAGVGLFRKQVFWTLAFASLAAIALMAASLWFVDIQNSRIWSTLQLFRMVMVVKWVGILLVAALVSHHWVKDPRLGLILGATLVIATSGAQAYAIWVLLIGSVCISLVEKLIKRDRLQIGLIWFGVAGMGAIALLLHLKYGLNLDLYRGALGLVVFLLAISMPARGASNLALASAALAMVLASTAAQRGEGLFGLRDLRAQFTWADLQDDAADIARAAGRFSPQGAIWIVPPLQEAFRLISGRAVVVDFKSIPFGDTAMLEWKARLDRLFGPITERGFAAGREMTDTYRLGIDWGTAAREFGATHAVLFKDTPWRGDVLYQNDTFKAVKLYDTATNN